MFYEFLLGSSVLFLIIYYYVSTSYNYWKSRGVKGPKPLPIIGNFGGIISNRISMAKFLTEIYVKYNKEPLVGIYSGVDPILIVKDPELVRDVLIKDFSKFAGRGVAVNEKVDAFAANLFSIDARRWRPLRSKLSPTFSSGKLKDMFYILLQCSNNYGRYLDGLISPEKILECQTVTSKFTADVIGACVFGLDLNTLNNKDCEFLQMTRKIMKPNKKLYVRETLKNFFPRLYDLFGLYLVDKDVNDFFIQMISNTIDYRVKNNMIRHDFVDILKDLKQYPEKLPEIELTDKVIAAQAVAFLIAGFFASSQAMTHTLYELALNPSIQEKLREEITNEFAKNNGVLEYDRIKTLSYLDAVFKETLRKYPPVTHILRQSVDSYTFAGTQTHIPKGQNVWIPVYPVHLDPNIYHDPQIFDPERFRKENIESVHPMCYLPFGDGPRNCIGARFAVNQTKVGIMEILKNFKLEVCEETKFEYGNQPRQFILSQKSGTFLKFVKIAQT